MAEDTLPRIQYKRKNRPKLQYKRKHKSDFPETGEKSLPHKKLVRLSSDPRSDSGTIKPSEQNDQEQSDSEKTIN